MSDSQFPHPLTFEPESPDEFVYVRPRRHYLVHFALLLLTFGSMLVVGARLQNNFDLNQPAFAADADFFPFRWAIANPARLWHGLPFAATLMVILFAHEMGHFLYCVRYGVFATLPYFIPAPTLFGTFGAFIRIRSQIRTRAALFDIGIAGPVAGFVVAFVMMLVGLSVSRYAPVVASQSKLGLGYPLIFELGRWLTPVANPFGYAASLTEIYIHPIAFAAWVGMFATALNLLPGGQLDGGHIVYGVAPRAHQPITRIAVMILIPCGIFLWVGWLVWAALLHITGARHPHVPEWPEIDPQRRMWALVALLMFVLTFVPSPVAGGELLNLRTLIHWLR